MCTDLLPGFKICLIRLSQVTLTPSRRKEGKVRFQISRRKIFRTKRGPNSIWNHRTDLLKVIRIKLIRNKKGVSKVKTTRRVNFLRKTSLANKSRCPKWIGSLSKVLQRGAERINRHLLTWIYPSLPLFRKTSTALQLTYHLSIPPPK